MIQTAAGKKLNCSQHQTPQRFWMSAAVKIATARTRRVSVKMNRKNCIFTAAPDLVRIQPINTMSLKVVLLDQISARP